eukprot:6983295-Prymnesium_polylepis.1
MSVRTAVSASSASLNVDATPIRKKVGTHSLSGAESSVLASNSTVSATFCTILLICASKSENEALEDLTQMTASSSPPVRKTTGGSIVLPSSRHLVIVSGSRRPYSANALSPTS